MSKRMVAGADLPVLFWSFRSPQEKAQALIGQTDRFVVIRAADLDEIWIQRVPRHAVD